MKKFFQNLKPSTGGTKINLTSSQIELVRISLVALGALFFGGLIVALILALIASGLTDILDSYTANGEVGWMGPIKLVFARLLGKAMTLRTTVNTEA